MRLTASQASALQTVRLGGVYYDDTLERFIGLGNDNTILEWADRQGLLTVLWRERQWRRVPVELNGNGELALRAFGRRVETRARNNGAVPVGAGPPRNPRRTDP